uniref:Uncharacterized protein n=1 Tax=Tetraselmis sp. GSL018 TaxID=582737 RepID=A0A061SGK0_9CHLO|eukprot:CAMPEP_0177580096 /NCGR_PEP_ID=MMETSP0419_2-20121207/1357_1 /TAXON_ID=582737 /ORGANISM="Tetraselmis sp., Strain GSL018" /LENGTH=290 /DNA_ID=CAMNT_0019068899 /DNA_START=252 /DNA_END=1124 /DNA_ORIENTATION=-
MSAAGNDSSSSHLPSETGKPKSETSLEDRVRQLPEQQIRLFFENAGVGPEDLIAPPTATSWGFSRIPRSDLEFPGEYIAGLRNDRWFHCPDSLDGMVDTLGASKQVECLRGSLLHQLPDEEQKAGVQELYRGLKLESKHAWAREAVLKGIALAKAGEYDKACQYYDQALELNPQSVDAFVAKGAARANQSRFSEAIHDFEKAIGIDPEHANAAEYLSATRQRWTEANRKSSEVCGPSSGGAGDNRRDNEKFNLQEELEEAFAAAKRKIARKDKKHSLGGKDRHHKKKHRK